MSLVKGCLQPFHDLHPWIPNHRFHCRTPLEPYPDACRMPLLQSIQSQICKITMPLTLSSPLMPENTFECALARSLRLRPLGPLYATLQPGPSLTMPEP